ncbi:hypothetical protein C1637_17820 [Chryseobacterium lactis]|uniref:EF-hand domain-containing protein n=1 Tax=Chryseobacterium lactis TaxID=1241981 RepID=A0A3G6RJ95_CHRLC|nr:hypothetical protein [Chryseobacterium lactis]AZA82907.1 hypothetical protein EG342_13930 [Chryseobacterium lactis]AZB03289.1 hypothetical protein EG341_04795 [Chryseobacterium lactis]PNW12425.1 hypothetical protein C1637_17820 [Chryseobacterium lactis]
MKRTIIASLFLIIACKEEKKEVQPVAEPQQAEETVVSDKKSSETEEAKKWLEQSIEDYFKADLVNQEKEMQKMTTKDYFDYKTDATNVDMDGDGSLTLKEFQDKWKTKFDVQKAGVGYGFLITGQDWEDIKISSCKLLAEGQHDFLFNIVLSDKKLNAEYPITVSVIKDHNSFLIADVWQKEPKLN